MEEQKKVFGYRIGESLYCPECYEASEKLIPKDSGVKLPGKALSADDLNGYFCNGCKTVKEAWQGRVRNEPSPKPENPAKAWARFLGCEEFFDDISKIKQKMLKEEDLKEKPPRQERRLPPKRLIKEKDLTDLQDMVEDCLRKIFFVESFFVQGPPDKELEMNEDDRTGLCLILNDIQDDLDMVVDELSEKRRKGEIIEKRPDAGGV